MLKSLRSKAVTDIYVRYGIYIGQHSIYNGHLSTHTLFTFLIVVCSIYARSSERLLTPSIRFVLSMRVATLSHFLKDCLELIGCLRIANPSNFFNRVCD